MSADFVYLASASPRRRELLSQIGVPFQLLDVDVDESVAPGEGAGGLCVAARRGQGRGRLGPSRTRRRAGRPVLAADTAVVLGGEILGKPADVEDAMRMLRLLSGRTHEVLTAVALATAGGLASRVSRSEVTFRAISRAGGARRTGIRGSRATRPAGMPSRVALPSSSPTCTAAIPGSWVCRCSKPPSC